MLIIVGSLPLTRKSGLYLLVMKEALESTNPQELVQLPSKLRIKQRLGHVSTTNHFKEQIVPKLTKLGGETSTVDEFIGNLSTALIEYPDGKPGLSSLGEKQAPKIINQLIRDPILQEHAINRWTDGVLYDHQSMDEAVEALQSLPIAEEA